MNARRGTATRNASGSPTWRISRDPSPTQRGHGRAVPVHGPSDDVVAQQDPQHTRREFLDDLSKVTRRKSESS